jgi:hypothetical protein
MKTALDAGCRDELTRRLSSLDSGRRPRWGRMNATQMIRHLTHCIRMANGEIVCQPKRTPLALPGVKHLVILVLPIPRSYPTAPELLPTETGDWAAELEALGAGMTRFAERPADVPPATHPVFGRLSRAMWGALVYKHTDHHLRQFDA